MAFTPPNRSGRSGAAPKSSYKARPNRATFTPAGPKPGLNAPHKLSGPGLGKAKKPAPKPPAKPIGRSATPDSTYYDAVDIAGRRESSRLSQLAGQEQATKFDFGIDDPTNPNSRAEGLKRAFLAKFRGQSAGIAAAGHLYSGQHERALARVRREEEEARANLRQVYEQAIGQIGAQRAGVKFDTEEQRNQAFEDWLARAPESEAMPVATDASGVTPMLTRGGDGTAPAAINPALALPAPTGAARTPSAAPKVKTKPNLKVKPKGNAKDILKRASKRR